MRAVGADPMTTGLDGMIGIFGSILLGSALAVGVALAMSPLFPIGPVRAVYPDRGVNADWTVFGLGFAILVGVLVRRCAAHRVPRGTAPRPAARTRCRPPVVQRAARRPVRAAAIGRRGHDLRR